MTEEVDVPEEQKPPANLSADEPTTTAAAAATDANGEETVQPVEPVLQRERNRERELMNSETTLWMGDVDPDWDENFIAGAFKIFGATATYVKIVIERRTGKHQGYCFVELPDGDEARNAMLNINGKEVPGSKPPRKFNLSFANSPDTPYTEYNIFVNGVPPNMTDAELYQIFGSRYRSCRGAKVYRNADGSTRNAGFVRFNSKEEQEKALVELNGFKIEGGHELTLKHAQPRVRPAGRPVDGGGAPGGGGAGGIMRQPVTSAPVASAPYYNGPVPAQQQSRVSSRPPLLSAAPPAAQTAGVVAAPMLPAQVPYATVPMQAQHPNGMPYHQQPQQQQPPPMQAAPTVYGSVVQPPVIYGGAGVPPIGAPPGSIAPPPLELEPLDLPDQDKMNLDYMTKAEELYNAIDESRWSKVIYDSALTEKELLQTLYSLRDRRT